jgi:hypothetical protein
LTNVKTYFDGGSIDSQEKTAVLRGYVQDFLHLRLVM